MKEYIVRIEHGADGAVHYFRTGGEIVRCEDCRYNYGNAEGREYNPNDIVCTYFETDGMDASDYCSYGERKTAESE